MPYTANDRRAVKMTAELRLQVIIDLEDKIKRVLDVAISCQMRNVKIAPEIILKILEPHSSFQTPKVNESD